MVALAGCLLWVVASLAGCGHLQDVRPLATGHADNSAYELTGTDLAALREEAHRLCPSGGEVLRQSGATQRPEATGHRWLRWAGRSAGFYAEPAPPAQMVVLCREPADALRLTSATERAEAAAAASVAAAAKAAAAAAAKAVPVAPAALPVGPVLPEW